MATADDGSAAIWVLAASTLLLMIALAGTIRTSAVLARHQAQTAADLSALAAAGQIGVGPDPCAAARRTAQANSARLNSCVLTLDASGRAGQVAVVVNRTVSLARFRTDTVTARARAGRVSACEGKTSPQPLGGATPRC